METQVVYKGSNSPFLVEIRHPDGSIYDEDEMALITRAKAKVNGEYADSEAHADAFDWATYAETGELYVDLGMVDLTVDTDNNAEIMIYDTTYTDGRVIQVMVIEINDSIDDAGNTAAAVNAAFGLISAADVTADGEYSGITEQLTAGETIAVGEVLCFKPSTGKVYKAIDGAIATLPATYIAVSAAEADATCLVMSWGYLRVDTWGWTVDDSVKSLFASSSVSGGMVETAPSDSDAYQQVVATIYDANTILFKPEQINENALTF